MPDLSQLRNPEFRRLPFEQQVAVMAHVDPEFAAIPEADRAEVWRSVMADPELLRLALFGEEPAAEPRQGFLRSLGRSFGIPTSVEEWKQAEENLRMMQRGGVGAWWEGARMLPGAILSSMEEPIVQAIRRGDLVRTPRGFVPRNWQGVAALLEAGTAPVGGAAVAEAGRQLGRGEVQEAVGTAAGLGLSTLATGGVRARPAQPRLPGRAAAEVAGVKIPLMPGVKTGSWAAIQIRELLEGSLVGAPLKKLRAAAQEQVNAALGEIANRISVHRLRGRTFETPADAFSGAVEALRTRGQQLYGQIDAVTKTLRPSTPARVLTTAATRPHAPQVLHYRQYLFKSEKLGDTIADLLDDVDVKALLAADPELSRGVQSYLAGVQAARIRGLPIEAYQGARTGLISLRKRLSAAGKERAARLVGGAVSAVDDTTEAFLKAIDAQRAAAGTPSNLVRQWRVANALWRRAKVTEEVAEIFRLTRVGPQPSILERLGIKPPPAAIRGATLRKKLEALGDDLKKVYGERNTANLMEVAAILETGRFGQNFAGHFLTLATVAGAIGGVVGLVTGSPRAALGTVVSFDVGAYIMAAAMANPLGTSLVRQLARLTPGTPEATFYAIRLVDIAQRETEKNLQLAEKEE